MTKVYPKGRVLRRLRIEHTDECNAIGGNRTYCACPEDRSTVANETEAEVVCSDLPGSGGFVHKPVIDLDFECQLVPSATPGHYHLYLDRTVFSEDLFRLLEVMSDIGLVERGYFRNSVRRGYAAVRHPNKPKVLL